MMGSQAIIATGHILTAAFRDSDIIARFGGDEFCDITYAGVKDLVGENLVPGVYCADAFRLSGTLTLSGSGVWIFKSSADLITSGTATRRPTQRNTPTPESAETPTPESAETPTPESAETPTPESAETPTPESAETITPLTTVTATVTTPPVVRLPRTGGDPPQRVDFLWIVVLAAWIIGAIALGVRRRE